MNGSVEDPVAADGAPDAPGLAVPPPPPPPSMGDDSESEKSRRSPQPWAPLADRPEENAEAAPSPEVPGDAWPFPHLAPFSRVVGEQPAPVGADGFPSFGPGSLAPLGRRAIARTIDTLLILVPFGVVALFVFTHSSASGDLVADAVPIWFIAAMQVAAIVYETSALTLTGRTLGKVVCGLRVEDAHGYRPRLSAAATRIAIPALLGLVPVIGWPIAVVLYTTARSLSMGRHLYDRLAGTVVVSTR